MIEERISKHLGKPYIYLKDRKMFLCSNGVPFTLDEYKAGIDINAEYERREREDKLYDYAYAKSTGLLRKKRTQKVLLEEIQDVQEKSAEAPKAGNNNNNTRRENDSASQSDVNINSRTESSGSEYSVGRDIKVSERRDSTALSEHEARRESGRTAVGFIIALLAFTSLISGYISTLQTATYLYDYVDMISAWLMSASVTAYNVTAFEVAVLFKQNRRYGLTFVFITLWVTVTVFSMATAVSVFYDRFNFNETEIAEDNKTIDSNKLSLQLLQKKEADLREAIAFKKQDIEYRQEHEYATTAVRNELVKLEADLQENLTAQQELLSETPEVTQEVTKRKERLFAFLGRMLHVDSGVFEFIMSTLSAIFVNLIAPLSLVAVAELKKKELDKLSLV